MERKGTEGQLGCIGKNVRNYLPDKSGVKSSCPLIHMSNKGDC